MILEKETFEKYGFWPKNFCKSSKQYILVKCDCCSFIFDLRIDRYYIQYIREGKNFCFSCSRKEGALKRRIPCKVGEKFGDWTIIDGPFYDTTKHKTVKFKQFALCKCCCGIKRKVEVGQLRNGDSKGCGCRYNRRYLNRKRINHGFSKTKLYKIWVGIKTRCDSNNKASYNTNYGKNGIKICKEWENFIPFKEWAENNGYIEGLSIDRIDPYKDYCPENCRCITKQENSLWVTKGRQEQIKKLEKRIIYLEQKLKDNNIKYE